MMIVALPVDEDTRYAWWWSDFWMSLYHIIWTHCIHTGQATVEDMFTASNQYWAKRRYR